MMAHSMEIERRFFIDGRSQKPWRDGFKSSSIKQYYLDYEQFEILGRDLIYHNITLVGLSDEELKIISSSDSLTSRIRKVDQRAILTMKGNVSRASAIELEWEIKTNNADEVINLKSFPYVEKTRYFWSGLDDLVWEVDEFEGGLAGLILAEVELSDESQEVELPEWLGMELTGLSNWSNAALAKTLSNN